MQPVEVEEERGGKSVTQVSYNSLIMELYKNMSVSRLSKLKFLADGSSRSQVTPSW